jgi:hypothetical protein
MHNVIILITLYYVLPMRKISTLIYLVDDTTIPLESILYESVEQPTTNELLNSIFEFIEVDPGSELITRILEHLNEQG